ncbi:MAG: flagellar motor switch protein FliN [Candidatus Gastranaerophilales bacterium]|nr:flagellar motor switch protein FliN [Candidatus Gastranaerophilales bacterium]
MPKKEDKAEENVEQVEEATLEPQVEDVQDAAEEITANSEAPQEETSAVETAVEAEAETEEETETDNNVNIEPVSGEEGSVTVQSVKFASFEDLGQAQGEINKNLEILMDIKLQMTVELGRTELPIKKVLELTRGSIIELEKVAGEPVELYANGKLVAHGEVVVIEDNFGLRITSITEPEDRLSGLKG